MAQTPSLVARHVSPGLLSFQSLPSPSHGHATCPNRSPILPQHLPSCQSASALMRTWPSTRSPIINLPSPVTQVLALNPNNTSFSSLTQSRGNHMTCLLLLLLIFSPFTGFFPQLNPETHDPFFLAATSSSSLGHHNPRLHSFAFSPSLFNHFHQ